MIDFSVESFCPGLLKKELWQRNWYYIF